MDKGIEKKIKEIVNDEINKLLLSKRENLVEGIDIDYTNKLVSFNPDHQDNVDTNDLIHPYIIKNDVRGEQVISLFERKDNDDGSDGNPLVYAMKGLKKWRFNNPKYDIFALLKRFVSVTQAMQWDYDTLLITPSSNKLNNLIFSYLTRLVNFKYSYTELFTKLSVEEVVEYYVDDDKIEELAHNDEKTIQAIRNALHKSFANMVKENNHVFSYKYIKPLLYRDIISQSLSISFAYESIQTYAEAINGKNVLVFDDTVATGKTLSDSANAIREMFDPESITFLTLFTGKKSQGNLNVRKYI